jgi:hypothetical protein
MVKGDMSWRGGGQSSISDDSSTQRGCGSFSVSDQENRDSDSHSGSVVEILAARIHAPTPDTKAADNWKEDRRC